MFLYPRVMVASEQDTIEEGNSTEKKNDGDMAEVFSGNSVFEGKNGIVEVIKGII